MRLISARQVFARVASQVPAECRAHLVVVGSLAAAYHLFGARPESAVRTKDMDCILVPRIEAVSQGQAVARALLAAGWRPPSHGPFAAPGAADTPDDRLPVVRLYPPDSDDWFVELLTVQDPADTRDRGFERVDLGGAGHYALATFRFLDVAAFRPVATGAGVSCARLAMLVLSNLLRNPVVRPERMPPDGTGPRRSNKDLGRVVAIAHLAGRTTAESWPTEWIEALRTLHHSSWVDLARAAGGGIRALLRSEGDLREAFDVSVAGLLAPANASLDEFRFAAERLLVDAIDPLAQMASR